MNLDCGLSFQNGLPRHVEALFSAHIPVGAHVTAWTHPHNAANRLMRLFGLGGPWQLQIKRSRVDMSSQGTVTGQEVVGAAVDPAGRKPKPKQKSKGGAAGGDSNDHGLVSLVLSLEARLRAVEAATYSVVLVSRETSLLFKNMREAGRKYAQLVEAKGRREHDLGSPHLHVFLALLSTLATCVPPQGVDQAVLGRVEGVNTLLEQVIEHQTQAELGEWVTTCRAEDCYDRPQQEKRSVVAPVRPDESNPSSSSRAVPTSRGNHDEADERTERARLALVRARREAQGGGRPHEERKDEHSSGSTNTTIDHRAIDTVIAGGTNTFGPLAERDTSTSVTIGSTCRAAPRLKWDSGGSLQRPRHVEQPAPRERTQIPVATQVL